MSYPSMTLPMGVGWNYRKTPKYSTTIQYPRTMRHAAVSTFQHSVVYEIELEFNYIKQNGVTTSNDFQYLEDFYEANKGSYGRFLFDPSQRDFEDMAVSGVTTNLKNGFFGVGDGVTTNFPLWRSTNALGGGTITRSELMQYISALSGIYVNGTVITTTAYTLSQLPAQVTFTTPPANGATLSWGGNYAYLCHFAEDSMDFNEFTYQLWELKSCKLETVLL